jgi:hypothetical protein
MGIAVLALLLAGELLSLWLKHFLPPPWGKGVSFFAVFLIFGALLGKRTRYGLLGSLALCILAGVIAFVGEILFPGW